jgi:mitochondrial fission protein ELM1
MECLASLEISCAMQHAFIEGMASMDKDDSPLKTAVFLDGRPGHEKQTLGIVRALGRLRPLQITEIRVDRRPLLKEVCAWGRYFLGSNDVAPSSDQGHYDLLIGTGSRTHIPMLSQKRRSRALCVTCMAPSSLLIGRFDLCCVPEHDGIPAGKNVLLTIGPPNCARPAAGHDPKRGLILLGGVDEKSHSWNSAEIIAYVQDLATRERRKRWTVSSSPRTPQETVFLLEELAKKMENIEFFRYENTAPGWVEEQYAANGTVWVTADSMSMVYEALSSGCHVGILPVAWKRRNSKFNRSERSLLEHDLAVSFKDWRDGTALWVSHAPLDEAGRCAGAILKMLRQKENAVAEKACSGRPEPL